MPFIDLNSFYGYHTLKIKSPTNCNIGKDAALLWRSAILLQWLPFYIKVEALSHIVCLKKCF